MAGGSLYLLLLIGFVEAAPYDFTIEKNTLTMRDGVKIAVTFFKPIPKKPNETFPVLLEMLPYRKDDLFKVRDYEIYPWFARHGYVCARVDVRGTGSSEGKIPDREYSKKEIEDALEIIHQFSKSSFSNGKVGMWGMSWGGFNALQVAMRNPPALKAVLAAHASDDLYHDDVRYLDGIFHVDPYSLSVENDLVLPSFPHYRVNQKYLRERFNRYPWFLRYLKNQQPSPFWKNHSLRGQYEKIKTPLYLIGGLLDGYRDSVLRILEHVQAPLKAEIGPWGHDWPNEGVPGPNYEWRRQALRWWDYWLKGKENGVMEEPRLTLFIRDSHSPNIQLKMTPGVWRYENWPIQRTQTQKFFFSQNHELLKTPKENSSLHTLKYVPSSGVSLGEWWGDTTPDVREADAGALVYDSNILSDIVEIIGFPKVKIKMKAEAPLSHWIVRLEDVHPDGQVTFVTGGALNGSQRTDPPSAFELGKEYELEWLLHFTTWTFRPGHRIRMAVSNAQFPMFWPTPSSMTNHLYVDSELSFMELPVIPQSESGTVGNCPGPNFPPPELRDKHPTWQNKKEISRREIRRDPFSETTEVRQEIKKVIHSHGLDSPRLNSHGLKGKNIQYTISEKVIYRTSDTDPAHSSFEGEASVTIQSVAVKRPQEELCSRVLIQLRSDAENFHVQFTRQILKNRRLLKQKTWREIISRVFQ